ncbi:MAG: helix-turn-helix domain-containing protein [Halobacteriovoraceae bacterium]|nr:helix-turn-helix domain-containing protein [Halobacteriovoraceae bacterium]
MADKTPYFQNEKRYNKCSTCSKKTGPLFENLIEIKTDENNRWLNTNEAAEFLRLTPNALRILVHRAQVKYYKFGRRLRFRENDLHSLILPTEV